MTQLQNEFYGRLLQENQTDVPANKLIFQHPTI